MNYLDIYLKRLNRYGEDYWSRIQGERERNFDLYLLKSSCRIDFSWNNKIIPASFERYKQNETKFLHYLLTRIDVNIPEGTILDLPDSNKTCRTEKWLVYYKEEILASGYNKYIMLKMTHQLTWWDQSKNIYTSWAYLYGQEDNMLKDEIKSRSRSRVLYNENLKSSFFILPANVNIHKDDYLTALSDEFELHFRITGFDLISTPGVEYVTIDPVYKYDLSDPPLKTEEDEDENFFWFNGGFNNGST